MTLHVLAWIAGIIPRAVGLPETIGIGFPLSTAAGGTIVGGLVRPDASAAERNRFVRRWAMLGLGVGASCYGLAVAYPLL